MRLPRTRAAGLVLVAFGVAGLAALLPTFLAEMSTEGALLVLASGLVLVLGALWLRYEWDRSAP